MHPKVSAALEEIDAAMFSGDGFDDKDARIAFMAYLSRWVRQFPELEEYENPIEKEPRVKEPTDYNRAQPSPKDQIIAHAFLDAEAPSLLASQVERKLGLLIASRFNAGHKAAMEEANEKNGFNEGFTLAIKRVQGILKGIKPLPGE